MAIIFATDDSFAAEVLEATGPIVLEFSKPGVNEFNEPDHSARTNEIIDGLAADAEYAGKVKFIRVLMDKCPRTVAMLGVTAVPTLLFIRSGPGGNVEALTLRTQERTSDFHLKFWVAARVKEILA